MNYEIKYLKYKSKYLKLKNLQKGGTKNKILPCEITSYTKILYSHENIYKKIKSKLDDITIILNNNIQYHQDPIIFLKELSNDFAVIINTPHIDIGTMKNYYCISNNSNDKGGNFISSPVVDGKSFIFYFVEASVSLIRCKRTI